MLLTGSRICHHLRDCHHHPRHHFHHRHHQLGFEFGLRFGFRYSKTVQLTAFPIRPSSSVANSDKKSKTTSCSSSGLDFGLPLAASIQTKFPRDDIPVLPNCSSPSEDDHERPSEGLSTVAGGIVALGKFDALHIGHRELAIQAAKVGVPFLLSFVGMAEVLGWEPSRAPIVAKYDRKRVLSSWASYCGNVAPTEFQIEFSKVRHLSPRQFVEKLSKELGVQGVVAGENYRFGYKASGDASELVKLCEEYGMGAYIISSVIDKNQVSKDIECIDSKEQGQVSSTRVRYALAKGDMKYVSELLGRPHRLMLMVEDQEKLTSNMARVSAPKSCLINLPPKEGLYENCSLLIGEENVVSCRVIIDKTHIHLELNDVASCLHSTPQDLRFLSVDFGESGA